MKRTSRRTFLNHEFSFGKQDDWLGPGLGGGFAFSNNAENFYSFRINRVEPLHVPGLSYITGPFRYEFVIGGLHGHTYVPNPVYPGPGQPNVITPGNPWMHLEKISFRPTENLEFGFERTVIWGGKGHGPITLHTFLKSFFSLAFADQRRQAWAATIPAHASVHSISPIDFPSFVTGSPSTPTAKCTTTYRPSMRPVVPHGAPASTSRTYPACPSSMFALKASTPIRRSRTSQGGRFMYWESLQKKGYTNNGQIVGDWIGREGKGGQGWITWHSQRQ